MSASDKAFNQEHYWTYEKLLSDGNAFFESAERGIKEARKTIDLEFYIFNDDTLGQRIAAALIEAAKRGVRVRVIVDGIGSKGWIYKLGLALSKQGIEINVYHQLPWEKIFTQEISNNTQPIIYLFRYINRRNHRKNIIIDDTKAWVGSMNIWDVTINAAEGQTPWREMGILVEGEGLKYLIASFELNWHLKKQRNRLSRKKAKKLLSESFHAPLRINSTFRLRRKINKLLIENIKNAQKRIYIGNAYFVPRRSFINAVRAAVKRGVDVILIVPLKSDIFFMPWVSAAFQWSLVNSGVKVFGYKAGIYHAKYMIIDDSAIIGSTNLNQRSFLHDLETDIISVKPETVMELEEEFSKDLKESRSITLVDFAEKPLWQKILGRIALLLKYYL